MSAFDYQEAFRRNIGLIQEAEQEVLRRSCVAVAGAGAMGGAHLMALTRLGIGRFSSQTSTTSKR